MHTYYLIYSSYDTWKGCAIVLSWVSDLSLELFTASQYIDRILWRGNVIIGFSKSQTSSYITCDLTIRITYLLAWVIWKTTFSHRIAVWKHEYRANPFLVSSENTIYLCPHSCRKNPVFIREPSQTAFACFGICTAYLPPLICTFYVVNLAFFWPPTHP